MKMQTRCWWWWWSAPSALSFLLLLLPPADSAAGVLTLNVSTPVTLGADVTMICLYNSTPPTGPVTWTINGQRISNGSHFVVYDHVLKIKAIDASVSGATRPYQCHVPGAISDSTVLTLNIPPVVRVQDVVVNESSLTTLLCENLRPSDAVTYSWEREAETLPNEVFADLQLPPVSRTDAGSYTCVAANSFGVTRATGQLVVQYLDLEAVSPLQIAVSGGTPIVQLVCRADSYPAPTFTWTTPPDVLSSFVTVASNGSESVLEVSPDGGLRLAHSGLYSCGAQNAAQTASISFRVIVQDFPAIPNRLQATMVTATSAQLSWRLPHDGNSPIERYYITITATNGSSPAQPVFMAPGSQNAVLVETLRPASTYQFAVVAENFIGNSTASEPLSFSTPGLPPDMPPFNFSLVEVGLRSLTISVEIPEFSAGVSVVTGCVAQYVSEGGVSHQSIACGHGSLSGLCPGTAYNISVAFVNAEGQGPLSESVGVTTNQGPPLPPTVSAAVEGPAAVRVQWTLSEANCYSQQQLLFTVQYQWAGQGEGQWTTAVNEATLTSNEYLVVGLQPSTQYRFRVGMTSRNRHTALGMSQTVVTLIGAPPTPAFIPPDTLAWSRTDQAIVIYFVLILDAEDDVIVGLYNTSDTAVSLTGLQDGRQYHARVRGVNEMGAEGMWSQFLLFTVQPPSTGAVSVTKSNVEMIAIGASLGALLCGATLAVVIGLLVVFLRLRQRHSHSFHAGTDRHASISTIPEDVLLSVGRKLERKAGLLPKSAPHQHHVHFTFDGAHTITSLSPPHHMSDIEGESSEKSPALGGCSARIDSDSLPSVSSMEAEPSEVLPTVSGGLGEEPEEIACVWSATGEEGEDADSIISGRGDLQLEPVVCEGEEMGALKQGGPNEEGGLSNHHQEGTDGLAQATPKSRSICLQRADSIESVV